MYSPNITPLAHALNQLYERSQKNWFWQRLSIPQLALGGLGGVLSALPSAAIFLLLYKFYMTYTGINSLSIILGVLGTIPTLALMTVFAVPKFASFLKQYDSNMKLLMLRQSLKMICQQLLKTLTYLSVSFFATLADSYVTYLQYTEMMGAGVAPILFAFSDFISTLVVRYCLLENAVSSIRKIIEAKGLEKIQTWFGFKQPSDQLLERLAHIQNNFQKLSDDEIKHLGERGEAVYFNLVRAPNLAERRLTSSWLNAGFVMGMVGFGLGLYAATYYIPLAYAANQALCSAFKIDNAYSDFAVPFTYITAACLYAQSAAETFWGMSKALTSYICLRFSKKNVDTSEYDQFTDEKTELETEISELDLTDCINEEEANSASYQIKPIHMSTITYYSVIALLSGIGSAIRLQLINEFVKSESNDSKIALMSAALICGFLMRLWSTHKFCQEVVSSIRHDPKTKLSLFFTEIKDLASKANSETIQKLSAGEIEIASSAISI